MRVFRLTTLLLLASILFVSNALARTPAPVPATWLDRALMQRGMLDRSGNTLGKPWMVDCAGVGIDHSADDSMLYYHFRCLITLGKTQYLQEYRTWGVGADRVTWSTVGKIWKLVPAAVTAP